MKVGSTIQTTLLSATTRVAQKRKSLFGDEDGAGAETGKREAEGGRRLGVGVGVGLGAITEAAMT